MWYLDRRHTSLLSHMWHFDRRHTSLLSQMWHFDRRHTSLLSQMWHLDRRHTSHEKNSPQGHKHTKSRKTKPKYMTTTIFVAACYVDNTHLPSKAAYIYALLPSQTIWTGLKIERDRLTRWHKHTKKQYFPSTQIIFYKIHLYCMAVYK